MARVFLTITVAGLIISGYLGVKFMQNVETLNLKPPIYKAFSIIDKDNTERIIVDIPEAGYYGLYLIFQYNYGVNMIELREFTGDGSYTYYTVGPGEPRPLSSPRDGTSIEIASRARKGEAKIVYVRQGVIVPLYVEIVDQISKKIIFSSQIDTGAVSSGSDAGIKRKILQHRLDPGMYSVEVKNIKSNNLPTSVTTAIAFLPPRQK